ncbi:retrovirus-related Pol polyprotein from transposon TNT 1-94 [Trichonephila clavipes]|nr:retrovirus-related Pol polyprotein from transposon TNT 1-94 [Trichonephila clavipes]
MLGYACSTRGYNIWLLDEKKLIETCNVLFDESKRVSNGILNLPSPNSRKTEWMKFKLNNPFNTFSYNDPDESGKVVVGDSSRVNAPVENVSNLKLGSSIPFYREAILRQNGKSLFDFNSTVDHNANRPEVSNIEVLIPRHFKDAKNSPQSDKWQDAMKEEIKVMKERDVWELIPAPQDSKVIGCRWVYTLKTDSKGKICRYKARLVAQGHNQQKGESYDETFSPVVNFSLVRLFFVVFVCLLKWTHCQLDIKCAYLYANLNEHVYIRQPQGFESLNKINHVCLLKKAIYRLHQSGREWYHEFDNALENLDFVKLNWCNCIYIYKENVLLIVYIDDIVMFGKSQDDIDNVVSLLQNFAANRDDRVSIGGLILMIHNVPISWRTFKHKCVSLSTMEAEYISLTEAAKEIIWIQNVINECNLMLKLNYSELPVIYCDNQAAINFSCSPVENHRTKHIDVRFHFLRNLVDSQFFEIKYINTKNNIADIFTKSLPKEAIGKFCNEVFGIV